MKIAVLFFLLMRPGVHAIADGDEAVKTGSIGHNNTLSGSTIFSGSENIHVAVAFVHGLEVQTKNVHLAKRFASKGVLSSIRMRQTASVNLTSLKTVLITNTMNRA